MYQYSVKFICGKSDDGRIVAPGKYWTAINVHNPTNEPTPIQKRVAIALPHEVSGPVSPIFSAHLNPYEALEIDCEDILQHAEMRDDFLKGFVLIRSYYVKLEVVAVYTAAGTEDRIETLHTERVFPTDLGPERRWT